MHVCDVCISNVAICCSTGIELFMLDSSTSYRVVAVYYTDNSDVTMRLRLVNIKQSDVSVIVLHHYNIEEVLRIFTMVSS